MRYRVSEIAARAGVSVDTIRFYQGQGLIDPPVRDGRIVWYDDQHLDRLLRIRSLSQAGFTLKQIHDLGGTEPDPLLLAVAGDQDTETMTIDQAAHDTGVSAEVLQLAVDSGLLQAEMVGETLRLDLGQIEMVRTVAGLLESGVDVDGLVALAVQHANATEDVVARAVDLYRQAVMADPKATRASVAREIRVLVPAVTQLVAAHFSQALVNRAAAVLAEVDQPVQPEVTT